MVPLVPVVEPFVFEDPAFPFAAGCWLMIVVWFALVFQGCQKNRPNAAITTMAKIAIIAGPLLLSRTTTGGCCIEDLRKLACYQSSCPDLPRA